MLKQVDVKLKKKKNIIMIQLMRNYHFSRLFKDFFVIHKN